MISVIIFGFIFNSSRWFELETITTPVVVSNEADNETISANVTKLQVPNYLYAIMATQRNRYGGNIKDAERKLATFNQPRVITFKFMSGQQSLIAADLFEQRSNG